MPKRSGLGQRGLGLLISGSPGGSRSGASAKAASEEKEPEKKASSSRSSASRKTTKSASSSKKKDAENGKTGTGTKKSSGSSKKTAASVKTGTAAKRSGSGAKTGTGAGSGKAGTRKKSDSAAKKPVTRAKAQTQLEELEELLDAQTADNTENVSAAEDTGNAVNKESAGTVENKENAGTVENKETAGNTESDVSKTVDAFDSESVSGSGQSDSDQSGSGKPDSSSSQSDSGQSGSGKPDSSDSGVSNEPLMVPISLVEPNRAQPRKNFDEDSLQELADSIKQFGVIQPLIVQKKEDYYEIIAGERRWRAARIASLKEVPVIVKDYTAREVMEISLIENIQREDLNPIEEAGAYKRLMDEYELKQDEVAERVSKSRAAIANSIRLLNLDPRVQNMIINEMISTGHARALLGISDPEVQYTTAQKVFDEKLTVRDVEKLVKKMSQTAPSQVKKQISEALQAIYQDLAEKMKVSLGTKVSIAPRSAQKGRIEIEYYSQDELDRLCSLLNGLGQKEEV